MRGYRLAALRSPHSPVDRAKPAHPGHPAAITRAFASFPPHGPTRPTPPSILLISTSRETHNNSLRLNADATLAVHSCLFNLKGSLRKEELAETDVDDLRR